MRLEKHLDKLREQYKAQKEEEETKRMFFHSPETARREGVDGSESSGGALDDSAEMSSHSEQTPEHSPAFEQRERSEEMTDGGVSSHMAHVQREQPTNPRTPPQVAPRPSAQSRANPSAPQPNGERVVPAVHNQYQQQGRPYNPYPPPAGPAPTSPRGVMPTEVAPPTSPDKEALFAFAWYHGSIPRDEALRRLEGVGGYDG